MNRFSGTIENVSKKFLREDLLLTSRSNSESAGVQSITRIFLLNSKLTPLKTKEMQNFKLIICKYGV